MKTVITKFLILWAISVAVLTLVFRVGLSYCINNQMGSWAIIISTIFGLSLFMLGWILGKKHSLNIFTYGSGFHFHFIDYLAFGIVSEIWMLFGYPAQNELTILHYTLLFWGIGVLIHFIIFLIIKKNKTIDGVNKSEIFE